MKTELRQEEKLIREGLATLQTNWQGILCKLYLTNQRLVFELYKFIFQHEIEEVELSNIHLVEKCWAELFGFFPFLPMALVINTKVGNEYRFTPNHRRG